MEFAKTEIAVIEAVLEEQKTVDAAELDSLQLTYVGGGIGDVVGF